jgi:hypothetical protein
MPKKCIDNLTNERNEVLHKILNILDISDDNNMISIDKIDNDINLQNNIIDLEVDIKKYFKYSRWNYFNNKNRESKRKFFSLIKAILKDMNVKLISSTLVQQLDNNKKKYETYYIIEV